jgi:Uncharacterised nucleotidyltransferase
MTVPRVHPFELVARVLVERLRGLEPSGELQSALCDRRTDWVEVVEQASEHFVLAAFAAALRDLNLAAVLEPELSEFLAAVHAANEERNGELYSQLAEVVAKLNRIDVEPVLLKGAIRLVDGLYPDLGWRMMWDLDLLVPQIRLAEVVVALGELGYAPKSDSAAIAYHYHYPPLAHPHRRAVLELHGELLETPRQRRLLNAVELIEASHPITFDSRRARLPSVEHQLVHLITHCQVHHKGHAIGRVALRDRLEAAALLRRSADSVRWQSILGRFSAAGYRRPLLTFLLSLDHAGFGSAPVAARLDLLTRLQGHAVSLQARSPGAMRRMWVNLRVINCAAILKDLVTQRGRRREMLNLLIRKTGQRTLEVLRHLTGYRGI